MKPNRRPFILAAAAIAVTARLAHADPFYMGTDVSLLPTIEQLAGYPQGGASGPFKDAGVARPAEKILVNHGDNLFRIRIFVNPQTTYTNTNAGAIQTTAYDIALAQRLKATGAKILLDFHYSDTWADPGKQTKPAAWTSLTFAQLQTQVRTYTRDTLTAFRDAGVMPEMVQIGNETANGMLWNSGSINYSGTTAQQQASWQNFGALLNSGISGVRDVDATVPGQHTTIALHTDQGDWNGHPQFYFDNITNPTWGNVSDFDVMGLSYYPSTRTQRSFSFLTANMNELVADHPGKKVMLLETNYPWRTHSGLGVSDWPSTQAGQQQFLTDLRNAVMNVNNGAGMGVVWWYPEAIQVPGFNIYNGGDTALFDASGNVLPSVNAFSTSAPTWNLNANGNWYNAMNWTGGVPTYAGDVANFTSAITAPRTVTLNAPIGVATINFNNGNAYTVAGTSTLTLEATGGGGSAAINVTNGSHVISAPVVLNSDASVNVASASSVLQISDFKDTTRSITKSGAGRLQLNRIRANGLTINSGTVTLAPASGSASSLALLSISPGAMFDLTDNDLIVTSTSKSSIEAHVSTKRLASSLSTPTSATGLGVLDGAEYLSFGNASFDGAAVSPTDVLVKYTWNGDANFDGRVTFDDYVKIDTGFGSGLTGWANGDFNYSGTVNFDDYVLIDIAFNAQNGTLARAIDWISGDDRSGSGRPDLDQLGTGVAEVIEHFEQFGASYGAAFLAAVPEPSALASAVAVTVVPIVTRRRRVAKSKV